MTLIKYVLQQLSTEIAEMVQKTTYKTTLLLATRKENLMTLSFFNSSRLDSVFYNPMDLSFKEG